MIQAAGGVVWRRTEQGVEVLVVHRPHYDDWSLPKGKLEPGEEALAGALREVEEECGLRCTPGRELPGVFYFDRKRRPKRVRYWEMQPIDGTFEPNGEVDEIRWVSISEAQALMSYPRDAGVLAAFAAR